MKKNLFVLLTLLLLASLFCPPAALTETSRTRSNQSRGEPTEAPADSRKKR